MERERCGWANGSALDRKYHDEEWGVPHFDDRALFEALTLEGAQAGLSWSTILAKREGYRRVFHAFDPERVASFSESDVTRLLSDSAIVRHRGKIESTVNNARAVLQIQAETGSFSEFIWDYVDGAPVRNSWRTMREVPAHTDLSRVLSRDLKRRGFRFVGPTTCYAFMQACGLVNDHLTSCFRYHEVG